MHPFAAIAVKSVGAGAVAALLGVGVVSAASPSPSPSSGSNRSQQAAAPDGHAARRAVVRAVIDSEAQVLGIKPAELVRELRAGKKVSDLAQAKGMTKVQFTARLLVDLKPRLQALVDHHLITQRRASRILARIASGRVPFWDGAHLRK